MREQSAVRTVYVLTGRTDVVQVVVPTLLMEAPYWREFAKTAAIEIELPLNYILCYLVGDNPWYAAQLRNVCCKLGKSLVIVPACENRSFEIDGAVVYRYATAVEFVALIDKADFVCTDSFHATAFSINLQKPFVEFLRFKDDAIESQNSRIYDVLSHYGLTKRIYSTTSDDWAQPIDYIHTTELLKVDRDRSLKFLIDSIER